MQNVLILVDGSNLYASVKALRYAVDFRKLKEYFTGDNLLRAVYFTALPPGDEVSSLRPMIDWMEYNGWTVEQKEWKTFFNHDLQKTVVKGNMDMEIAVTAMLLADKVTDIVLFSGDGDFTFLVRTLQGLGVRVTVVSTIETKPPFCADTLRRAADTFVDLAGIKLSIQKD